MKITDYKTDIPGASHWSLVVRRGTNMTVTDKEGGANVGMLFYNPDQLTEKYNAPDTLKCQHTFKLTQGHCLYSDMGRIFCSIIADSFGWHESVCGNTHKEHVQAQWSSTRDYQKDGNHWMQNGYDSFLVELAKYKLTKRDFAANINFFSRVITDDEGSLKLQASSEAGDSFTLRFEMDTLVVLHTCPHPLNRANEYPRRAVSIQLSKADTVTDDDQCMNACEENKRGFKNNALYHMGTDY